MSDIVKTVEGIRQYLGSTEALVHDGRDGAVKVGVDEFHRLEAYAQTYAYTCRDINQRAYECQELLNRGQRQKAMLVAKRQPDLRIEAQAVEFPGLGLWLDVCERLKLPLPDFVDTDVVSAVIDDVYDRKRAVEDLLCLHRSMAMARAPLQDRLRILRKLCKADPQTEFWKEDVATYEHDRVEELVKTAEQANSRGDLQALDGVCLELRSDQWFHPPGGKLLQAVTEMIQPHRRKYATQQYGALAESIREAHGAMNEERCRSLMEEWSRIREETGFDPGGELVEQVAPTVEWLADLREAKDEDNAYRGACNALERAIDDGEPGDRLEKLAAEILRFDRGMSQLLAARLNSQMEGLHRSARRKFTLRLVGVVGAVILLAAGITVGVIRYGKAREISRWHDRIVVAIEKGDMKGVDEMLAGLKQDNPSVSRSPEIEALRSEYKDIIRKEGQRRTEYEQCMAAADKASVAEPDENALSRAEKLARSFEEKSRVQDWRERIQSYRNDRARELRRKVDEQMEQLDAMYADVVEWSGSDTETLQARVNKCLDQCVRIRAMPDTKDADKTRVDKIWNSVRELRDQALERVRNDQKLAHEALQRKQSVETDLAAVVKLSLTPQDLAPALHKFGKDHQGHALAAAFTEAAAMSGQWEAVEKWRLLAKGGTHRLAVTSFRLAASRKTEVHEYLRDYGDGPYTDAARHYEAYLSAAVAAMPEGELKGLTDIAKSLRSPLLSNVAMVRTKSGMCYYCEPLDAQPEKIAPDVKGNPYSYTLEYITDLDMSTKTVLLKVAEIDNVTLPVAGSDSVVRFKPAPQVRLCSELLVAITRFNGAGWGWETFYLQLASSTLANKDVDAILRAKMVRMLLKQAFSCGPYGQKEIAKCQQVLDDLYLDDVAWMNPHDYEANRKRKLAETTLKGVTSIPKIITAIKGNLTGFAGGRVPYMPAGVILGDPGEVRLAAPIADGTLHVLWQDGQDTASFRQIGFVTKGSIALDLPAVKKYPMGTPVYVRKD